MPNPTILVNKMNKAPTINATLKLTAEEWKGQREKEMISILGSWDRSVSQKILIIQLSESNENYSFFMCRSLQFICVSLALAYSLNYFFFYFVLCVHFSVFFSVLWHFEYTFFLHRSVNMCSCVLLFSSLLLSYIFILFCCLILRCSFVTGLCICSIVFSLSNCPIINVYVLYFC